jgi:hypothetical protein
VSYTYTGPANSAQDQVRFQVDDVSPSGGTAVDYAFEDAEIAYSITREGTADKATVYLLKILLNSKARRQRAFSAQGVTYDDKGSVDALIAAITQWGGAPSLVITEPNALPFEENYTEI